MTENAAITEALTDAASIDSQVAGPSEDEALGSVFDRLVTNNGAERGEDGKFKSVNTASPGGEEGAGEGEGSHQAPVAPLAPVIEAPGILPQAVRDSWAQIPETARAEMAAWATEQRRKFGEQGQQLASVKPIADKLGEAVAKFPQFKGMTPERLAQGAVQLAAVQVELESGPEKALQAVLNVAQTYNVLPQLKAALTGQQMPEGSQEISSLKQEITALKRQLASVVDPSQIETHVSRVFEGRAAQDVVNQFATDPANSFFPVVEPHLPGFIAKVKEAEPGLSARETLAKAYNMAIDEFPALKTAREAAVKAAAAPQDAERTAAAKKAASINVKSTSTGKERQLTELEALGAAFDRATAS